MNGNGRAHRWYLLAIVLLVIATVVGLSALNSNLNDHEKLDKNSCERALKNRELLKETLESLVNDPGGRSVETQKRLQGIDDELSALINESHNCS